MPYRNDFRGPRPNMYGGGFAPGPGGRRPNGGFPIWVLFLAPFFVLSLIDSAPELLIFVIIGIAIFAAVKSMSKTTSSSTKKTSSSSENINDKIDDKLSRYFEHNSELAIVEGITLVPVNGTYSSVDSLMVTCNGEKVCSLSEFKEKFPEIYRNIYELLKEFSRQKDNYSKASTSKKETKKEVKQEEKSEPYMSEEDRKLKIYVDKINKLNSEIPNEEITNGLYRTTDLLTTIIKYDDDKVSDKVTKLYDYYLPMLVSILEKYKNIQNNTSSEEFSKRQNELNKTIILINEALKTIIDNVNEKQYDDLSADMSTLQSLLSKDGYSKDPFKK